MSEQNEQAMGGVLVVKHSPSDHYSCSFCMRTPAPYEIKRHRFTHTPIRLCAECSQQLAQVLFAALDDAKKGPISSLLSDNPEPGSGYAYSW